jgi:hypothetical protein
VYRAIIAVNLIGGVTTAEARLARYWFDTVELPADDR